MIKHFTLNWSFNHVKWDSETVFHLLVNFGFYIPLWIHAMRENNTQILVHNSIFIVNHCLIQLVLTLTHSNPIFLPTTYSPALHSCHFPPSTTAWIQCTITCSHQNTWPAEKQKEYNLCYLLAKVHTTWGNASDRLRQQSGRNKNVSDVFQHRSRTGKS